MSILFVTGNKNKFAETQKILEGVDLINSKIDLPELQGASVQEIAIDKCREARRQLGGEFAILTEDTSLCFNAMGNLPGPYIKWFMKSLGHDGINKMISGFNDNSAHALCIFALSLPENPDEIILFEGRCDGHIVMPRGNNDFGWDAIFQCMSGLTFAEMSKTEKNEISHRANALKKLNQFIVVNQKKSEF